MALKTLNPSTASKTQNPSTASKPHHGLDLLLPRQEHQDVALALQHVDAHHSLHRRVNVVGFGGLRAGERTQGLGFRAWVLGPPLCLVWR